MNDPEVNPEASRMLKPLPLWPIVEEDGLFFKYISQSGQTDPERKPLYEWCMETLPS